MEVYTIGFTRTTAAEFFRRLKQAGIRRLIDVRLNNTSHLAGFAKRDDLEFFLAEICGADYLHELRLAPTQEMLDAYKRQKGSWEEFEERFLRLMAERQIETVIEPQLFTGPAVLLCSEPTAERCHRRLILEYLDDHWGNVEAVHL
ncbi:MAG TPA: DUF488 domain-containing protein [Planctomycetaceae bacterium]|nr:DUF488 domain-containing protein [Planctomycetaceae bacterium]